MGLPLPKAQPKAKAEPKEKQEHKVECPKRGDWMQTNQNRKNKGFFWGCVRFPLCGGTRRYKEGFTGSSSSTGCQPGI